MQMIDVTVVTVALPPIAQDLDASAAAQVWIPTAYLLAFACALLTMARLGDVFGRRFLFVAGAVSFALASVACAVAPDSHYLIAARVAQGVAGAAMSAQTVAIVTAAYRDSLRTRAFALYGAVAGLAGLAGPSVGGLLIDLDVGGLGWRAIFLVNVPVGALTAALGGSALSRRVNGTRDPGTRFDPIGSALWSLGTVLTVYPIVVDLSFLATVTTAGTGATLLATFVVYERIRAARGLHVLMLVELFAQRAFASGCTVSALLYGTFTGFVLTVSITMQSGLGKSATTVGLLTVPFAAGAVLASLAAPALFFRYDSRVVPGGALMLSASLGVIGGLSEQLSDPTVLRWVTVPLFFAGAGLGAMIAPLQSTVVAGIDSTAIGSASGMLPTVQQIGSAVGTAAAGAALFSGLPPRPTSFDYLTAQQSVLFAMSAVMAFAAALAFTLPRTDHHSVAGESGDRESRRVH
ncbi:MFS transporter [Rhodococcoides trifolii]|uniref:MFS transporter n=2 Tax=Rhodococcoides trifolii TaxID=908250 RepID=A0A917G691_9NOCA|nr:MFS transporter [Rhodococcus trifolii]